MILRGLDLFLLSLFFIGTVLANDSSDASRKHEIHGDMSLEAGHSSVHFKNMAAFNSRVSQYHADMATQDAKEAARKFAVIANQDHNHNHDQHTVGERVDVTTEHVHLRKAAAHQNDASAWAKSAVKHANEAAGHFNEAAGHYTKYVIPDILFVVRVEPSLWKCGDCSRAGHSIRSSVRW